MKISRHTAFSSLFVTPALAVFMMIAAPANAQVSGAQSVAEREIQRRQTVSETYAPEMIARGQAAMNAKDYESAFSFYRAAVDALPPGGAVVSGVRATALDGFSQAAVALAKQRISEGRFQDAEDIVDTLLADYNPNYGPALTLEKQLADPSYFNRTHTPQFLAKIEEVKQLLTEADGFYQSGRYDLAFRRYEQVLNIDRYNIAARRGMERVNNARDTYATNARNQTRAAMITEVDRGWELPVPRRDLGVSTIIEQPQLDLTGAQQIAQKLENIIIPRIEFNDATIREAINFVRDQSIRFDTTEPDQARRGVNIVLLLDPAAKQAAEQSRITLSLTNAPLGTILDFIAEAAGLKTKVETHAVAIVPLDAATDVLITKEYTVPPSFVNRAPGAQGADAGAALTTRAGARQFLESLGVTFPEGASAQFIPSNSKLIVRNTPANLNLIDTLVEIALNNPETQVEIQSKFLEVTQNNLQQLGIDWLIGQFALPFGSGVYGSGGTSGNQGVLPAEAFPQGAGNPYQPFGANSVTAGNINSGQVTAGNRSGAAAIRANALDALLFGTPAGVAPGVLSVAGVFTNPQFQVVLRALDQAKGVDLMSAPTVTTMSGMPASIQIIQEFIYPENYDPPQVPGTITTGVIQPVTPATPQSFAMENVGVTLNVNPRVESFMITLELQPVITNFDGFINYGSPINTVAPVLTPIGSAIFGILGTQSVQVTENRIEQPVFSYREVQTEVTIQDGQTVALGGLIREDVQATNDKVPIIGDVPLLGRAFRTESNQRIKRNLIIFVTANLLDPSGKPINQPVMDDLAIPGANGLLMDEIIPGDASSIEGQL